VAGLHISAVEFYDYFPGHGYYAPREAQYKFEPFGISIIGVEQMYDVTDFLFMEIWRGHTDRLENLVDICFQNRASRSQRVILKVYPADMNPNHTS
jgi:hypothetical protein